MLERNYSFFHHYVLSCHCVMFQKQYFELTKMRGVQAAVRGGTAPRSDGTASKTGLCRQNGRYGNLNYKYKTNDFKFSSLG